MCCVDIVCVRWTDVAVCRSQYVAPAAAAVPVPVAVAVAIGTWSTWSKNRGLWARTHAFGRLPTRCALPPNFSWSTGFAGCSRLVQFGDGAELGHPVCLMLLFVRRHRCGVVCWAVCFGVVQCVRHERALPFQATCCRHGRVSAAHTDIRSSRTMHVLEARRARDAVRCGPAVCHGVPRFVCTNYSLCTNVTSHKYIACTRGASQDSARGGSNSTVVQQDTSFVSGFFVDEHTYRRHRRAAVDAYGLFEVVKHEAATHFGFGRSD